MNDKFASGFAQDLESMIALKRALGYSENTYLERAKSFDRHCFEVYPGQQELTQAIVLSWLKPEPRKSPQTIHGKAAFVRALGKYQKSIGKAAYKSIPPQPENREIRRGCSGVSSSSSGRFVMLYAGLF